MKYIGLLAFVFVVFGLSALVESLFPANGTNFLIALTLSGCVGGAVYLYNTWEW